MVQRELEGVRVSMESAEDSQKATKIMELTKTSNNANAYGNELAHIYTCVIDKKNTRDIQMIKNPRFEYQSEPKDRWNSMSW